jgi:hypothetical protein
MIVSSLEEDLKEFILKLPQVTFILYHRLRESALVIRHFKKIDSCFYSINDEFSFFNRLGLLAKALVGDDLLSSHKVRS